MKALLLILIVCSISIYFLPTHAQKTKFVRRNLQATTLTSLVSPNIINAGTNIASPNGYFILKLLSDGTLSMQDNFGGVWYSESTPNRGTAPYKLKMETNGRFYIQDSTNVNVWNSDLWVGATGNPPFRLVIQNDANLLVGSVEGTTMYAKNVYISAATKGCVRLFTGEKFASTMTELCTNTANLSPTASSLMLPDKLWKSPCTSGCFNISQMNWVFEGFVAAPADSTNANQKILNFDAYGNDFFVGMFSSNTSSAVIYNIIIGGWQNFQTKVYNSSKSLIGCNYMYGVPDPLLKYTYQIILDNSTKTMALKVNGTQVFNCSIPSLAFSSITYWGFSSSWPSQVICPLSSSVSTSATNCSLSGISVTAYSQANYLGTETIISNPSYNLSQIALDKKIASIKINPQCYTTCSACFELGTSADHKCCSCLTNFYPLLDNSSQCYSTSNPPVKYWFSVNKFRPCYSTCQSCSSDGLESSHNCGTCITGYYKVMLTSNCVNVAPANYYLNTTQGQYRPCYSSCATCSADGTASSMNCLTCANGYLPLSDFPTSCVNTTPQNYYFNSSTNKYNPCFSSCLTCSGDGDSTNNNCLTCRLTHMPVVNTNNCVAQVLDPSSFTNLDTIDSTKKLIAPNEYWSLQLQTNGLISVSDSYLNNYHTLGNTGIGTAPYTAKVQTDGIFYIYSSNNSVIWNTTRRTSVGGSPFRFQIQQDMNLVLTSADGPTVLYAPDINIPSFPNAGCVWLYTGTKFSLTKSEICSDNPNIPKTTSSILLPDRFLKCSCTSTCYKITGTSWSFSNFQAATQDTTNSNMKILEFDAFGSDLLIGMLSSNTSSSVIYQVLVGGYANLKTRVLDPSRNALSGCDYNLLYVNNPYTSTKYKFILNNTSKSITMFSNGNKAFECSIPSLSYTSITQWGFSNSSPGQNVNDIRYICPLKTNGLTDSSDCMWTTTTIKVYTDINFGGTETILTKPIFSLSALNLDKQIGSIKVGTACYTSCGTCNLPGTADNHKCCTCAANNFPLSDNSSQCYTTAAPPTKYVLVTNQFKPCYTSCQTCSLEGTAVTHNCLICITSYYKIMSTSNCVNAAPSNYYLNTNSNEYRPCFTSCDTCSADGTSASNECLTCKTGYYPLIDNSKNCFNTTPDTYFFDSSIQKYKNCFASCNSCISNGTSANHICTNCKPNYYKVQNTNNCFLSSDVIPKYYFNSSDNLFKSCPSNCDSCSNSSTCSTCSTGYAKNLNTNLCEICHTSCSGCNGIGSDSDNKCSTCNTNYYFKIGSSNCYLSSTSIPGFFFNSQLSKFSECTAQVKTI